MKIRVLQFFSALVLMMNLLGSVFAQHELIINGEFTNGNTGFVTQYHHKPSGDVSQGEYCIDNNCQGHNNLGLGWPSVPGTSGKYMIVNGEGWDAAPSKIVWKQTVNVTSQTTYDFSCKLVNLSRSIFGLNASPSILRIRVRKSNGAATTLGDDVELNVANHNWQTVNRTWSSGSYCGELSIEIYDVYDDDPDHGDDFGLDQISFVPRFWYDVNAQDDYVTNTTLCLNDYVDVDVLQNDGVLPNMDDAQVEVVTNPAPHGTAGPSPLNNKKIRYTFTDANYNGEVQIVYRVTIHCVSSEATIHINTAQPPTINVNLNNIDPICAGYSLDLPTPNVQSNGSAVTSQGWQIYYNGAWQTLNNNNIPYEYNGCSIRYFATNGCDTGYSSEGVLTVNDVPTISVNLNGIAAICAGSSLDLPTPNVQSNGSAVTSQGWQIYYNGGWQTLNNNNIPYEYNGCNIRYKAHNGCGDGFSDLVAITVYSAQPIVLPDVTFCQEGYYHGVWCSQDGHEYGYDSLTPNNCTIHVSWLFHLSEDYNTHPQTQTECDEFYWPQTGITYHNSGIYYDTIPNPNPVECDDVYILNLTINHSPIITEQLESPNPIEVCSSVGALNVTAPAFENGGTSYWEYATSENGPWNNGFNPASFNLEYGSYWLRYVVDNDCADVPVPSNPVPFYVSEAPAVSIVGGQQLHDMELCDGDVPDWPQVVVEWNDQPGPQRVGRWEKALSFDGPFAEIPDTTMGFFADCWIRYYVQNTCDTQVLGPVHVSVINMEDITTDHLGCDTVEFGGVQYTADIVIDELVNEPCPHTIHHNIIVHHSEYTMEPIPQTTCHDEFVWHGQIYYRSDGPEQLMHFDTLTEYDCPKVLEQQLVFSDYSTKIEPRIGCGTYTWPRNDSTYYYDENQMHIQDSWFIPGDGEVCDSIIYLSLDLDREYEYEGDPMTECRGFEWHGVTYYEDAIVYDSLTTKIAHCDSIISYRLTIIQPFDTIVEMESCKPKWWHCQDQENLFDVDGEEYTATLTAQMTGCDSIVTIRFSLLPEITLPVEDVLVCEPFVLPDGQIVDHSDLWSYTIHSLDECDTIVQIQVEFIQTDTLIDEPQYACDSLTFHGFTYGPGIHEIWYDTVFAPNGCIRSVQLLNLTVKDSEQVGTINGASNVYVASSLISGIYRYEIDTEGLAGPATWSLSNPDWQIIEQGDDFCRVFVSTPGNATLTAHFNVEECGEMERSFEINAVFYGVDDYQGVDVHIFPNPTKGSVTIETEGIESLRLIDMMGQVLETREYDRSDSVTLNLSTYTPSVYLFEIKTVYGVVKKRLILCR